MDEYSIFVTWFYSVLIAFTYMSVWILAYLIVLTIKRENIKTQVCNSYFCTTNLTSLESGKLPLWCNIIKAVPFKKESLFDDFFQSPAEVGKTGIIVRTKLFKNQKKSTNTAPFYFISFKMCHIILSPVHLRHLTFRSFDYKWA